LENLVWVTVKHDFAVLHDYDVVCVLGCEVEPVFDEDDGYAEVPVEFADDFEDLFRAQRV
jgi:hypothetical protein